MSPAFQSPHSESEWSRRDAIISNLTNVRLTIFELDEPGFLNPLILRRADPADTQSRIWWTSGYWLMGQKTSKKRQVHRWSKNFGYRVTPHLKAVFQRCLTSDSCTYRLITWRKIEINPEQACIIEKSHWRDMSMPEDGNPVCTYSSGNSWKKFGFVTTSIELNEHDFWARCIMRMQGKQVPVQMDCH